MRRIDLAQQLAAAAREAERLGNHREAADLFAEALKTLLLERSSSTSSAAAVLRGEMAGRGRMPRSE
jgi:hypothetical protein